MACDLHRCFLWGRSQGDLFFTSFSLTIALILLEAPGVLKVGSKRDKAILDDLENHRGMRRLVGYSSSEPSPCFCTSYPPTSTHPGAMKVYAPALWSFKVSVLNLLELGTKSIRRTFQGHPMAGTTFNFGPQSCCYPHKDFKNLSWGWCSITSLGTYDPTKGGHLALWDLKLVVEFPPYSTIFIPSALLMHGNATIASDETRMTVTQYNSGGLFTWVAHKHGPKGEAVKSGTYWWDNPKPLFSKLEGLLTSRG